jgi:hypothetical protein
MRDPRLAVHSTARSNEWGEVNKATAPLFLEDLDPPDHPGLRRAAPDLF